MTVHTAACTPDVCIPAATGAAGARTRNAAAPAPRIIVPILIAKIHEAFAVLHDVQWRAPWDEPGKRWVNLR